jgi:internalin A
MENAQAPTRNSIFISYAREDKRYLDELHAQMRYYVRKGIITSWDDTLIRPGAIWWDEIQKALQSARVAIFLVSADLLASDFIAKHELPPLLEAAKKQEVAIISVILRACVFGDTELSVFQAGTLPSTPLNQLSRGKREEAWKKVVSEVKKYIQEEI